MPTQPTLTLDYDGFPVEHPAATLTFVQAALSQIGPSLDADFGVDFRLSDSDRKLVRLNKTDLGARRMRMQTGLALLFRSSTLRRFLESPGEYAAVIHGFCMVPRRSRVEPHIDLTFALTRNAEPVFDFKFELASDEISGLLAETSGKLMCGYHYSVDRLSRQTIVGTVIPEILSMIIHRRWGKMGDEHMVSVVDVACDDLLDVSKCYLSPD